MSIATDIRSYADSAVSQGKQVLGQAQAQFNDVTGKTRENVVEVAGKAGSTVAELRASAEHAIKAVVEPYLAQAKDYRSTVTERAETLFATVKNDERFARFVDTAETVTGVVVETVQERVVKPVQSLTGRGGKPVGTPAASTTRSPSAGAKPASTTATTKPAATKPAATKPATTKPAAATKATSTSAATSATTKPASKAAPRKAPTRKTTES